MQFNFKPFEDSIKNTKDWLSKEYASLHTGAASPMVLDGIMVDSYGTRQPVKNVASISIEDPKTLRVIPWDKSQLKEIEKEILTSDLGLSVATDSTGLRVIFPMLTTETREKLVKVLKGKLEDARVAIRKERENNLREIDRMSREGEMSEDEKIRNKEKLQGIVDEANSSLEAIFSAKENVVMGK
jgi:ribosome recycling factor